MRTVTQCSWEGCGDLAWAKGLCSRHYYRQRRSLDMDAPFTPHSRESIRKAVATRQAKAASRAAYLAARANA